jgi:hypothetical protein
MAQPKRQHNNNTAIDIAEYLHKYHTHAEIAYAKNPQEIVYTEQDVIKILTDLGHPEPDFANYAKIASDSKEGYMNKKRELLRLSTIIKEGMIKNKIEITRLLSGANMTAATMMKLERVLNIKLLNH